MPIKNVMEPYQTVTNGDMAGNITSGASSIRYLNAVAIQFVWTATGTPNGAFTIEATVNGTDWIDLGITISVIGSAGKFMQILSGADAAFDKVRVKYTASSGGTGALAQVWIMAKEI